MTSHMPASPNDTRTELIRAALACFAVHGFDETSMRMIAKRAGRPISLFPHYFGNKEGLYVCVFKWLLESHILSSYKELEIDSTVQPQNREEAISLFREQIHAFYSESSPVVRKQDPLFEESSRLLLQEVRAPRPSLRSVFIEHFSPRIRILSLCIKVIRPDLDDAKVAFIGISILGQVIGHGLMHGLTRILWDIPEATDSSFRDSELLVSFSLNGLNGVY